MLMITIKRIVSISNQCVVITVFSISAHHAPASQSISSGKAYFGYRIVIRIRMPLIAQTQEDLLCKTYTGKEQQ